MSARTNNLRNISMFEAFGIKGSEDGDGFH